MLGKPKYKENDTVSFYMEPRSPFSEKTLIIGKVFIVDAYGTFEQNKEPSYDIMDKEHNILFKHVRESCLIEEEIENGQA